MSDKYRLFKEFKDKLENINLYSTATHTHNEYTNRVGLSSQDKDTEYKLIDSLINENTYVSKLDINSFNRYIDGPYTKMIKTSDPAQINTLKRLNRYGAKKSAIRQETKHCPHCGMMTTVKKNSGYAICGYSNKGFNWKGCGYDWCTSCDKKLCKSWSNNMLFNIHNRYHNSSCCKNHALSSGSVYPDEYCMCKTEYVDRDK